MSLFEQLITTEIAESTEKEDSLTHNIIGAAIEVHRGLGPGLLESAYEACLIYELRLRGINVKAQQALPIFYKDVKRRNKATDYLTSLSVFSVNSVVFINIYCRFRVKQRKLKKPDLLQICIASALIAKRSNNFRFYFCSNKTFSLVTFA